MRPDRYFVFGFESFYSGLGLEELVSYAAGLCLQLEFERPGTSAEPDSLRISPHALRTEGEEFV